jgi:hypothetical protein
MGLMALKHLVYYAENHGGEFRKLIDEYSRSKIEETLPIAAAGVNISQLLRQCFHVGDPSKLLGKGDRIGNYSQLCMKSNCL